MTVNTFTDAELKAHNAAIRSAALAEAVKVAETIGFRHKPKETNMTVRHLNQIELAARWNISHRTLERWRWSGEGPRFIKIGGRVVYRLEDIEEFEAVQLCKSTADKPPGMVCVPVEPTKEMCEAAEALPAIDGVNDLPLAKAGWSPRAIQNLKRYRAMLAAHGGKE